MVVVVEVGVALTRPPRVDRYSRVVVSVETPDDGSGLRRSELEAELTATLIAAGRPGVVMAVSSRVVDVLEL